MPFVNIQILKGHPQERKDEMARRVTAAVSELAAAAARGDLGGVRRGRGRGLVCRVDPRQRAEEAGGKEMNDIGTQRADVEIRDRRIQRGRRRPRHAREDRHRLPVHRGAALACGGELSAVQRHAGRSPATMERARRRHHVPQAVRAVERARLGPPGSPHRVRARDQPGHAHRARRAQHGHRQPPRRQGAEQPERRGGEIGRRHLLHRSDLWAQGIFRQSAPAAARLPRRLPRRAGRRR